MDNSAQRSPKNLFADFDWNLMGFGLCRAWITLLFSLSIPAILSANTITRLWLLLPGALFCLLLIPAPKLLIPRQIRTISLVLSGIFAFLGLIGIYFGINHNLIIVTIISMALLSISAALMQVLWGEKTSLLPEKAIDFYTISAMLLAAVIGSLLQIITDETARWICLILLPIGSWVLLYRGFDTGKWEPSTTISQDTESRNDTPAPSLPLGRFCISIFVFVIVFNAISPAFSSIANPMPMRTTANLVVTLGLFILILGRGAINLTSLYTLSFIMLLGSVLAMLFVSQDYLYVPMFFAAAGYKLFDILFWCLLITMAHYLDKKKWGILGLGMAANFGGMALGSALGGLTPFLQSSRTIEDAFIISTFSFILAITIVVILPERLLTQLIPHRQSKQVASDSPESITGPSASTSCSQPVQVQSLEERCQAVALSYRLTKRESEVFILLAQGRTQSVIAKKLGISEGTVHTHILHVYQKLGVHSQQELIEFLD